MQAANNVNMAVQDMGLGLINRVDSACANPTLQVRLLTFWTYSAEFSWLLAVLQAAIGVEHV